MFAVNWFLFKNCGLLRLFRLLKNKSTIGVKNSINSKEISNGNTNTASKNFLVTDSIDFHVTKLAPENDTSESKKHVLLPFPYEDEVLPTQTAVSTTTTTTTLQQLRMQTTTL